VANARAAGRAKKGARMADAQVARAEAERHTLIFLLT